MVETSVAVATPSTTAPRIRKGSASAGKATTRLRAITAAGARAGTARSLLRARFQTTAHSTSPTTKPGSNPPVNRAAIDTPVTEPMVIRIRLGGTVSVCAEVAASKATRSPRVAPRRSISGNSTGAIAAMSAALEPEMPETR